MTGLYLPIAVALLAAALLDIMVMFIILAHRKAQIVTLTASNEVYGRKLDEHHGGAFTCSEALTKARAATDIATRRAVRLKEQLVAANEANSELAGRAESAVATVEALSSGADWDNGVSK